MGNEGLSCRSEFIWVFGAGLGLTEGVGRVLLANIEMARFGRQGRLRGLHERAEAWVGVLLGERRAWGVGVLELWETEIAASGGEVDILDQQRQALDHVVGAAVEYWDIIASWRGIYGIWLRPSTGNMEYAPLVRHDRDVSRDEFAAPRVASEPRDRLLSFRTTACGFSSNSVRSRSDVTSKNARG